MKFSNTNILKKILSRGQVKTPKIIQRLNAGKSLGITKPKNFCLILDVSHCNLKCVLCPNGGIYAFEGPGKGYMSLELLKKIVDKFVNENVKISHLEIGSWGEPLLNPDLPKMIYYARLKPGFMQKNAGIFVNTNLNHLLDPASFLKSGVNGICISISGMTQKVYSRNHAGGHIKSVIDNILKLVEIRNSEKLKNVKLLLKFFDCTYNKKEAKLAEKFCKEHGIAFSLHRARIMGVDCNIKFQEQKERLSKLYSQFIDVKKEMSLMTTMDPNNVEYCNLRLNRITINFDSQLFRCCNVFEKKFFMGSFFDFKIRAIPKIKSEICKSCAETPMSGPRWIDIKEAE